MGHLAAPTMAGRRLAWPDACRRWLPVWLPGTGGRGWIEASQAQNADIRPGPENWASRSATAAGSRQYQAHPPAGWRWRRPDASLMRTDPSAASTDARLGRPRPHMHAMRVIFRVISD